jgi:hypothetical protein
MCYLTCRASLCSSKQAFQHLIPAPFFHLAATPADRTAKRATVIRRTSTIGDVKVNDPRFMEAKAEKNNGTLEANCMKTANLEEQQGDGRPEVKGAGTDDQGTEGGDRKKTSLFQLDDPILYAKLYGTPSLDARNLAGAPIPSALLDSFRRNNERNRVPPVNQKLKEAPVSKRSGLRRASANKIGPTHENRDQKEAPLPLSTGLEYFARTEQDRFVSPLKKGGNKALESVTKCSSREADGSDEDSEVTIEACQMRKDFVTRSFGAREGSREVTFSEAARRATEECWDLVSSIFEWVVITFL